MLEDNKKITMEELLDFSGKTLSDELNNIIKISEDIEYFEINLKTKVKNIFEIVNQNEV